MNTQLVRSMRLATGFMTLATGFRRNSFGFLFDGKSLASEHGLISKKIFG
jgi:hypothetical protein